MRGFALGGMTTPLPLGRAAGCVLPLANSAILAGCQP